MHIGGTMKTLDCSSKNKETKEVLVECEICDRTVKVTTDHPGVYVCASCRKEIASSDNHRHHA